MVNSRYWWVNIRWRLQPSCDHEDRYQRAEDGLHGCVINPGTIHWWGFLASCCRKELQNPHQKGNKPQEYMLYTCDNKHKKQPIYLPMCALSLSRVWLFVTLWIVVREAPLSMRYFRWEYWSRLPFSPPGDLPDPGIGHSWPCIAGRFFTHWAMYKES